MRALLLTVMLAASLAACGEARTPDLADTGPSAVMGQFRAASDNARSQLGDVSVERAGLIFAGGAVFYTRTLDPRVGADAVAQGGDSYASIALGPSDLRVELRRVTEALHAGAICGDGAPAYIALVHEERPASFTLLVFSGDEPPGPAATRSRLCASYRYDAPQGARTREGVVLY